MPLQFNHMNKVPKNQQLKCCKKGSKIALKFCDQMSIVDKELFVIGRLCEAVADGEMVDNEVVQDIGWLIRKYFEKKWVVEHFYFDRCIDGKLINDNFIKAELFKLEEDFESLNSDEEPEETN